MKLNVDGYLNHSWEQHCAWEEENKPDDQDETVLAELAFDQFEFDAKVDITVENYDLIREVFMYAFNKGRKS
jgi:hypothetical protein